MQHRVGIKKTAGTGGNLQAQMLIIPVRRLLVVLTVFASSVPPG